MELELYLESWAKYKYLNALSPKEKDLEEWLWTYEEALVDMGVVMVEFTDVNKDSYEITYIYDGELHRIDFNRNNIISMIC